MWYVTISLSEKFQVWMPGVLRETVKCDIPNEYENQCLEKSNYLNVYDPIIFRTVASQDRD